MIRIVNGPFFYFSIARWTTDPVEATVLCDIPHARLVLEQLPEGSAIEEIHPPKWLLPAGCSLDCFVLTSDALRTRTWACTVHGKTIVEEPTHLVWADGSQSRA